MASRLAVVVLAPSAWIRSRSQQMYDCNSLTVTLLPVPGPPGCEWCSMPSPMTPCRSEVGARS